MIISVRSLLNVSFLAMLSLAGVLMSQPVQASSSCSPSQSSAWQICGPIEAPSGVSVQPSVIQANDGTLSMAWTGRPGSTYSILYATGTWNGTSWNWTPGSPVAGQTGTNQNPTLVQFGNGTVDLFFTYKSTKSGHYQLYFLSQNGGAFSKYSPVPLANPTTLNDTLPSATLSRDGTLWLVWTRDNTTLAGTSHVMRQLWYKTFKGNAWSTEQPLTLSSDVNWNFQPSVVAGKDGIIRVAFAKGSGGLFQIYYMNYTGSIWTTPVQLTSQTTTQDSSPSITQDRNGTFWVFWARNVPVGTSFAYEIYSRSNSGSGWTSETLLTGTTCGVVTCVDSEYPAAVQSTVDKNIWVFYATNPVANFNIWALKTATPISPVHDVVISYFTPNASLVYPGGFHDPYTATGIPISQSAIVVVNVTVQNWGDFNESVTISLTATNTTNYGLGSKTLQVSAGSLGIIGFSFNTTGVRPARYGISGNASIPVETVGNKPDGILTTPNLVHILPMGDVDQDGSDTLTDVTIVFHNYNSTCYTPSTCSPGYIIAQWGDFSGRGVIDIVDATIAAHNFNTFT